MPSKGNSIALWLHEFFEVYARKRQEKTAKKEVEMYQALEFRKGCDMPVECRVGLSEKELEDKWVHGVYYAPASVIRRANVELQKERRERPTRLPPVYFKKTIATSGSLVRSTERLSGIAPELVSALADVLHLLPRVMHPVDVQKHEICVNGRDWHYLCGVIGTENLMPRKGNDRLSSVEEGFKLKLLDRKLCTMYPEVKLGGFIDSTSAQWQVIDALFQGMRNVMRSGTAFTSGTFFIAWSNGCQTFWEVHV
jgi:hypothetical protein